MHCYERSREAYAFPVAFPVDPSAGGSSFAFFAAFLLRLASLRLEPVDFSEAEGEAGRFWLALGPPVAWSHREFGK